MSPRDRALEETRADRMSGLNKTTPEGVSDGNASVSPESLRTAFSRPMLLHHLRVQPKRKQLVVALVSACRKNRSEPRRGVFPS